MKRELRHLINLAELRGDLRAMQALVDKLCSLNTGLFLHNPKTVLPDRDGVDFATSIAEMQHLLAAEIGATSVAIDNIALDST